MRKYKSGFTLVEVIIVTAIIALLASLAIPNLIRAKVNANDAATQAFLKSLSTALETYATANSAAYPVAGSLAELAACGFATSNPPYLNAVSLTTPQFGHNITFAGSIAGYQIAANTTNDNISGAKNCRMSTFAVLESEDCTEADYTATAP